MLSLNRFIQRKDKGRTIDYQVIIGDKTALENDAAVSHCTYVV